MPLSIYERAADLERRLQNVLRFGVVAEVDTQKALCRVEIREGVVTAWLPWLARHAGDLRTWAAPAVGERVVVLSPSGNLNLGVVLPGLYCAEKPAPSTSAAVDLRAYPDGTVVYYDTATKTLSANLCAGGSAEIVGKVRIVGDVEIQGRVDVSGDVKAGNISLETHVHGGVQGGGGTTSAPQ